MWRIFCFFSIALYVGGATASSFKKEELSRLYALSFLHPPQQSYPFPHLPYVNPHAPKGGRVRLGSHGRFDSLNPFALKGKTPRGVSPFDHPSLVFATLMAPSFAEPGTFYPYVAEAVILDKEQKSIRFFINPRASFHDGTLITAEDVAYSLEFFKAHLLYKNIYKDITEARIKEKRVIEFIATNLSLKMGALLLARLPILKKEQRIHVTDSSAVLIGSGPYSIKSAEMGKSIVYQRVPHWWGEELPIFRGRFNFDEIEYHFYLNYWAVLEAFKAGLLDTRFEFMPHQIEEIYRLPHLKDGRVRVIESNTPMMLAYEMVINTRRPELNMLATRQALALLFDFEWVNKNILYSHCSLCKSYFNQRLKCSETEGQEFLFKSRSTLAKACALLHKAGWTTTSQGLYHPHLKKYLELTVLYDDPAFERILHAFARQAERVGVRLRLYFANRLDYLRHLSQFEYDIAVVWAPPGEPSQSHARYWHSSYAFLQGSMNYAGVRDSVVDQLLKQLGTEENPERLQAFWCALDHQLKAGCYRVAAWDLKKLVVPYWPSRVHIPQASPPLYDWMAGFDSWWAIN